METVSIPAHFDGERIQLDKPYDLPRIPRQIVTVLSDADAEREDWLRLSLEGGAGAYGEDEPEYTLADVACHARQASLSLVP